MQKGQGVVFIPIMTHFHAHIFSYFINPSFYKKKYTPFSSPEVCDKFLPDLLDSKCQCVGRCKEDNLDGTNTNLPGKNEISSFYTVEGIAGCRERCANNEECNFFTLSKVDPKLDYTADQYKPEHFISTNEVDKCTLWKRCLSFEIPENSTYPFSDLDAERGSTVSLHWSGPGSCTDWKTNCPLADQPFGAYNVESVSCDWQDYRCCGERGAMGVWFSWWL